MRTTHFPNALVSTVGVGLVLLAGCGGSGDESTALMPSLMSSRLDVALADLEEQGVVESAVQVVGGGAFGVLDEGKWLVCEQRPAPGQPLGTSVRLVIDRSCDTPDDNMNTTEGTAAEPAPTAATEPPGPEQAPATALATPEEEIFVMPDFRGMNLQLAQDTLQSLGSYLLDQEDASGLGRVQILDSGWQVCGQSPPAGAETPIESLVVLSSVRVDESCP